MVAFLTHAAADDLIFTGLDSLSPEPKNHVLLPATEPLLSRLFPGFFLDPTMRRKMFGESMNRNFPDNDSKQMRDYQQEWAIYLRSPQSGSATPIYNPSRIQRAFK
jgi:hypothetical protein